MTFARFRDAIGRSHWLPAALSALFALLAFKQFGVGWDDPLQSQYGDRLIAFYATGGTDESYAELADLRYYGGAFEIPAQLAVRVSPWTPIETRRLLGGLVGALGVLGCGALGSLLGGASVGWIAAALLATWPVWAGHAFVNSKDVPFATAFVWAAYYLVRVARAGSTPRPGNQAGLAIWSGLATGTRAGGLVLFAVYACLLIRALAITFREATAARMRSVVGQTATFGLTVASSWGIMMLVWPWTQAHPLSRPFEALELMRRFPRPMEVLFQGKMMVTTRLPWDYVPIWLGATLPPLVVILLLIAVPLAVLRVRNAGGSPGVAEEIVTLLAAAPLIAAIAGRVVLYDGIRQILFVVPLLMVIAAWAAIELLRRLPNKRWQGGAIALAAFLSLDPIEGLVRLHPYQYAYFNRFVGGLRGAAGRFETDYWGLALREAAEWVNRNQGLLKSQGRLKVHVPHNCAEPTSAGEYLDPAIVLTPNNLAADYVLAPTRFACDQRFEGTVVQRIERQGVVLAVVKALE